MFPTTSDHSSFTLITLPSIKLGCVSVVSPDFAIKSLMLRNCASKSIRAFASLLSAVFKKRKTDSLNRSI